MPQLSSNSWEWNLEVAHVEQLKTNIDMIMTIDFLSNNSNFDYLF